MTPNLLIEEFDKFKEKFSAILHYQRLVKDNSNDILKKFYERAKDAENLSEEFKDLSGSSLHNFYYPHPINGMQTFYSHKKTNIQEAIELTHLIKNKQYQWLLVEAYEAFEDFIEVVYAICGSKEAEFWREAHSNKLPNNPDLAVFKETAKTLKISEILNRLRAKAPDIKKAENGNERVGHLRFHLILIEKIRHIVVHANGVTTNKEKIIRDILHACNVPSNLETDVRGIIEGYFGSNNDSNHIILLENTRTEIPGLQVSDSKPEVLINRLLSYSHLVIEALLIYFSEAESA